MATTVKQKFLSQAYEWLGAKESGGQNKYAKGTKLAEIFSTVGASQGTAWCAVFVSACAKKAKAGKVIGTSFWANGVCQTVLDRGGKWIPGPARTKSKVVPNRGDLILYVGEKSVKYNSDGTVKKLHGSHVGIVYKVTKTKIISIEGNLKGGKSGQVTHGFKDKTIAGFARPKWSKVDGDATDDIEEYDGPLYATENDRHDMTMREVGYMDGNGKLTTSSTKVKIALINYTSVMGGLYDMFTRNIYGGYRVDTSKLSGKVRTAVETYLDLGFNAAAACALAGNIQVDSSFNPAAVDKTKTKVGICLWGGVDATQMKEAVGDTSWATNLSGQLDYVFDNMVNDYPETYLAIHSVTNDAEGVKSAAKLFAEGYRGITDADSIKKRQSTAQGYFSKIVITPPVQKGTTPNPSKASTKCSVLDLSKIKQNVIPQCLDYFEIGACDTSMYNEWTRKGTPTDNGLIYVNQCYFISIHTKYSGNIDDYVEIDLTTGGTATCIIAGHHNDVDTPILLYRARNKTCNLSKWKNTKIKTLRNYGKRK